MQAVSNYGWRVTLSTDINRIKRLFRRTKNDTSDETTRLSKWALVAILVGLIILFFLGPNLPNSGVVQLETALIQVNGFLLAFVAVAFTGMVAEVRSRIDLGIDNRRKFSKQIRRLSLQSFTSLIFALTASLSLLTNAIASPNGQTAQYLAYFFPMSLTILGITHLLMALLLFTKME